jgi:mono/diheme cytochrome c family protein
MKPVVSLAAAGALAVMILAPMPAAADDAALWKSKCGSCHGPDGAGQTAMGKKLSLRDLGSAEVQKQSDAELTRIITDGKGKMPPYKGKLTDEQIKVMVGHIRSFKK